MMRALDFKYVMGNLKIRIGVEEFKKLIEKMHIKGQLKYKVSKGSSTSEFLLKSFKIEYVILVNRNNTV